MDYAESREIIHRTSILNESDTAFIDQNIGEIQRVWDKRQIFRTETEMRMSVLQDLKFPTIASKYWQAVRELSAFYEQLVQASFEYRRTDLKIRKIQHKMLTASGFKLESLQIDLEEQQFSQINQHQLATDRMREIRLWTQIMGELKEADPNFDWDDVNKHQLESYTRRFENQEKNLNSSSTPGEVNNLLGQLQTARRIKKERDSPKLELKESGFAVQWKQ